MLVKHKLKAQHPLQKKLAMLQVKKKHATQKMIQKLNLMKSALMKLFNISPKKNQAYCILDIQVVHGVKKLSCKRKRDRHSIYKGKRRRQESSLYR